MHWNKVSTARDDSEGFNVGSIILEGGVTTGPSQMKPEHWIVTWIAMLVTKVMLRHWSMQADHDRRVNLLSGR